MIHPYRVPVVIATALIAPAVVLQAATPLQDVPSLECTVGPDLVPDNSARLTDCGRFFHAQERGDHQPSTHNRIYTCPMHPDVRTSAPGSCPRCGMALVPMNQARSYRLDLETVPDLPTPGQSVRVRLTVRDARTTEVVRDFAVVHTKRLHLFLLSQDLEHYEHMHPTQDDSGAWVFDVTLPCPGIYKLYADFQPEDGIPQVLSHALVTAGVAGNRESVAARLVRDPVLKKTVGGMSVALELPPGGLIAGSDATLTYRLTDARTGAPVTDIEPYLGAWGHTLIMSEDMQHFVHAHPSEHVSGASARTGPELRFNARLPESGHYRIWTQVKRHGEVSTAIFTIAVAPPSEQ